MFISKKGIELIKHFEGLKLEAYQCSAGIWTIGIGTTYYKDTHRHVKEGDTITVKRAEELLRLDINRFQTLINKVVDAKLSQDQFDVLVSFTYNIGSTAFRKSTLLKKLKEGDYPAAALEFRRWNKAGGKVVNGLVRRRKAEEKLFCGCVEYL